MEFEESASPKTNKSTQTELNPVFNFISNFSLKRVMYYSNPSQKFSEKQVLYLSRKRFRGRPCNPPVAGDKDFLSNSDKDQFVNSILNNVIDYFMTSCRNILFSSNVVNQDSTISLSNDSFEVFAEENCSYLCLTKQSFVQVNRCQNTNIQMELPNPKSTPFLFNLPENDAKYIFSLLKYHMTKDCGEFPLSNYSLLIAYYISCFLQLNVLNQLTSIDCSKLQIFASTHTTNAIAIISFGLLILSKFLQPSNFGSLFRYWIFCLPLARNKSTNDENFDKGFQVIFSVDQAVEIFNTSEEEDVEISMDNFLLSLESEFENFFSATNIIGNYGKLASSYLKDIMVRLDAKKFLSNIIQIFSVSE